MAANKNPKELGLGDCIDCNLCVQVCPTGIDIRNGLQYECINCGACIDACDGVMDKMNYPRGLISYTTERNLKSHSEKTKAVRPKLIGYVILLVVLSSALVVNIATRKPMELDIIRDRNQLYRENFEGLIENTYTLKVINKAQVEQEFTVEVQGLPEFQLLGKTEVSVEAGASHDLPISIVINPYLLKKPVTEFEFVVRLKDNPEQSLSQKTNFFRAK